MPLLEVTQSRKVSATIHLDDATATQLDQYAAFIRSSADRVIEQALVYVFSKDREFQEFLKTPEAAKVTPTLRIRKVAQPAEATNGTKTPQPVQSSQPNGSARSSEARA
jgi:hypothetical protein